MMDRTRRAIAHLVVEYEANAMEHETRAALQDDIHNTVRKNQLRQQPHKYRLAWTYAPTDAPINPTSSRQIHWEKFYAHDKRGRTSLKDLYSKNSGNALLGFEVDIDILLNRAILTQVPFDQKFDEAEVAEETPRVIAAAATSLLDILREAVDDDIAQDILLAPPPLYLFSSRGAEVRPTIALLVTLAKGLRLEHPRMYGGHCDTDVNDTFYVGDTSSSTW